MNKSSWAIHIVVFLGGLVDIGHLRDLADMTKYVYEMLISGKREFQLTEGRVMLTVPQSELNGDTILELAGAIAYVESWAHELSTWRTRTQDFSSFSCHGQEREVGSARGRSILCSSPS